VEEVYVVRRRSIKWFDKQYGHLSTREKGLLLNASWPAVYDLIKMKVKDCIGSPYYLEMSDETFRIAINRKPHIAGEGKRK